MDAITAARFVEILPEFAPVPSGNYEPWVTFSQSHVDPGQWADLYEMGAAFWIAHQVAMGKAAAKSGGAGTVSGPMTTKRVDKVAAGYDTSAVTIAGAGSYNATSYGIRFLELQRLIGAGPIVV